MKRVSYRTQGLILVAVVALSAHVAFRKLPPNRVSIAVEGPIGTKISGAYEVDGVEYAVAAEVPMNLVVTGRHIELELQKDGQPGEIAVRLSAAKAGTAKTTAGPNETVRCGFLKKAGFPGSISVWAHGAVAGSD